MRADSSAITVIVFIECPSVVCVCVRGFFFLHLVRLFIRSTFIYQNVNNKRTYNPNTCVFSANERRKNDGKFRKSDEYSALLLQCTLSHVRFFSLIFFLFFLLSFKRSPVFLLLRFSSRSIFGMVKTIL